MNEPPSLWEEALDSGDEQVSLEIARLWELHKDSIPWRDAKMENAGE